MEKKKTTTKKKTTKTPVKSTPKTPGLRREVWGIIWCAAGLLSLLVLLPIEGAVLRLLKNVLGGLLGVGAFFVPVMLFALAVLLFRRDKGPVRLQAGFLAVTPVVLGALVHAVIWSGDFTFKSAKTLGELMKTGAVFRSGGLVCGELYLILEWAFSWFGAMIVLVAALLVCLALAPHISLESIKAAFEPPEYEYESEEERARYEAPTELPNIHVAVENVRKNRKKPNIAAYNIALDDEPLGGPAAPTVAQPEPLKPPIEPAAFLKEQEAPFHDILDLVHTQAPEEPEPQPEPIDETPIAPEPVMDDDLPPWEDKPTKAEKQAEKQKQEAENAKMAAEMDESQSAPAPVYVKPPIDLLIEQKAQNNTGVENEMRENSARLVDTLQSFGIDAQIIGIVRGPSVTRFELTISRGIKFSRITALADDIALSLGAVSVRIAPIPDKVAIGIEVPNKIVNMVTIRECIASRAFQRATSKLSFAVGKDITGAPVIGDIAKMPHLLIAGTTGSGKSVCVNSMLISILYHSTPEEVRLIMVDPKMVELGNYNGIPHLLIPVVTDPKKAAGALNWSVGEMERRYKLFADNQVRNLAGFNDLMRQKREEALHTEGGNPELYQVLPQIVIVIDELADLMMVAAKEVETSICRIAQKARAAGMHLIVATQRPSADVITGIMKANIPSRIAFAVASQIESRIILDQTGAEKLIGKGDMLYAPLGGGKPQRIQGCFISSDEIESVIARIKESATAEYNEEILEHIERQYEAGEKGEKGGSGDVSGDEDEMLMEAIDVVLDCGQASVSMLQRRLKLGYSRAARIVDQMEERGIVGPFEGSKPRQILISKHDWREMQMRQSDLP